MFLSWPEEEGSQDPRRGFISGIVAVDSWCGIHANNVQHPCDGRLRWFLHTLRVPEQVKTIGAASLTSSACARQISKCHRLRSQITCGLEDVTVGIKI